MFRFRAYLLLVRTKIWRGMWLYCWLFRSGVFGFTFTSVVLNFVSLISHILKTLALILCDDGDQNHQHKRNSSMRKRIVHQTSNDAEPRTTASIARWPTRNDWARRSWKRKVKERKEADEELICRTIAWPGRNGLCVISVWGQGTGRKGILL